MSRPCDLLDARVSLRINLLDEHIVGAGDRIPMRFVTIGVENLMESKTAMAEKAFGVKERHHYGLSEAVANSQVPDGVLPYGLCSTM